MPCGHVTFHPVKLPIVLGWLAVAIGRRIKECLGRDRHNCLDYLHRVFAVKLS